MSGRRVTGALLSAPLVACAAAMVAGRATGLPRRLGATGAETRAPLPGDDLLPRAEVQNDRASTMPVPPRQVWPWIAQLGQDKAGFYSFEALENLAGCQIVGATRVHPEWQDVTVGDAFRLHPDVALRVADVDPGRCLVVTSQGGDAIGEVGFDMTWAFFLAPIDSPDGHRHTRLHLRERYETTGRVSRLMIEATSYVSALMTWRMMQRLEELTRTPIDAA